MPIFEYLCEQCETRKEAYVSKADEEVICPRCESKMKKLLTGGHKIRPSGAANLRCGKRYT